MRIFKEDVAKVSDLAYWLLVLFFIHFHIFMEFVFPDVALKTFRGFNCPIKAKNL